jgi:hypothetical protein
VDKRTIKLVTRIARRIEDEGLTPAALDALARAGVDLTIDWHPTVVDAWRATVTIDGRAAPLVVDPDAATAAARALRSAAVHGVDGDSARRR